MTVKSQYGIPATIYNTNPISYTGNFTITQPVSQPPVPDKGEVEVEIRGFKASPFRARMVASEVQVDTHYITNDVQLTLRNCLMEVDRENAVDHFVDDEENMKTAKKVFYTMDKKIKGMAAGYKEIDKLLSDLPKYMTPGEILEEIQNIVDTTDWEIPS